jgi:hypothetical protein
VLLAAAPAPVAHAAKCDASACRDIDCATARTLCLIDRGEAGQALELLSSEEERLSDQGDFHLLVAASYLAMDDTAGALATLDAALSENPGDCQAMSWLAWVYVSHGLDELAGELLDDEACRGAGGALGLRYELLETLIEVGEDEAGPRDLGELDTHDIYEEDIVLARHLRSMLMPSYVPPLTIRAAIQGGYSTNAMSGSPKDPAFAGEPMGSPLISHEVTVTLAPLALPWLSPHLELSSSSTIFLFDREWDLPRGERASGIDPYDFTSFDLGLRAGVTFLRPYRFVPSVFLGYRGDVLFLNMEDRYDHTPPVVFYEGHRAEVEVAPISSVVLFAGFGRRFFREDVRTRFELDGGVGLHGHVAPWLTLMGAASLRRHWTARGTYDLVGASVLGSTIFDLWRGIQARVLLALHLDRYDSSTGTFHPVLDRRDTTVKLRTEVLSMPLKGIRLSVLYEFSDRLSSAPDYAYVDHRVMLRISFGAGIDFLGLGRSEDKHVPLDYGLEVTSAGDLDSIQDLLRTDEQVRGGPGCGCAE